MLINEWIKLEGCECRIHRLHCIWDLYQQVDLIWDVTNRFLLHGRCSGDPVVHYNMDLMAGTWRCEGSVVIREALVVSFFEWWSWNLSRWRRSWAFLILGEEQVGVHIYGQIFKNLDLLHQVTLDTEELEQGSWAWWSTVYSLGE